MTYVEYDIATLPKIVKPFNSEQEATTRYLGNRAITGDEYAELSFLAETDAQAAALYEFWKTDLNHGTLPFLAPAPHFGAIYTDARPNTVFKFIGSIGMTLSADTAWSSTKKVKVVGTVDYLYDDAGAFLYDDSGAFLYDDAKTNSNKEITYA